MCVNRVVTKQSFHFHPEAKLPNRVVTKRSFGVILNAVKDLKNQDSSLRSEWHMFVSSQVYCEGKDITMFDNCKTRSNPAEASDFLGFTPSMVYTPDCAACPGLDPGGLARVVTVVYQPSQWRSICNFETSLMIVILRRSRRILSF